MNQLILGDRLFAITRLVLDLTGRQAALDIETDGGLHVYHHGFALDVRDLTALSGQVLDLSPGADPRHDDDPYVFVQGHEPLHRCVLKFGAWDGHRLALMLEAWWAADGVGEGASEALTPLACHGWADVLTPQPEPSGWPMP